MRVSGLASGIDTESIIRDMMAAKRIPLDKITQKKQYLEWQLDSYRDVNRQIRSFNDNLFDTMMKSSTFMAKSVSVSNEDAVSIKGKNANGEFSGSIEIHQLAKAATWQGGEGEKLVIESGEGTTATQNSKVGELQGGWLKEGTLKISVPNGDGGQTENVEIEIGNDDTIKDVVKKLNDKAGVSAFYDERSGQIAMTAKNSGNGNIKVQMDSDPVIEGQAGQDAEFTFNGLKTSRSSNTFDINGFEVTLKEVTTNPVNFTSAPDTDKVVDSVKKFVEDYNKLIEELNGKIREPKYRDFAPLSAEQKADMKDKEIELWEEKAMSGTLKNDPTIQRVLSDMRLALQGSVETSSGKTMNLASIGITTSKDYLSNGKLEIDEEKLRAAINENPNDVHELFASSKKEVTDANGNTKEQAGLITTMRTGLTSANKTITERAGNAGSGKDSFTLGRNLKEMDKQIERFQERLKKSEETLWRQFSAMEQAMNRANAQAQQLMNGLGGMM